MSMGIIIILLSTLAVERFHISNAETHINSIIQRKIYWVLSNAKNEDYANEQINSILRRFGYYNKNDSAFRNPFNILNLKSLKLQEIENIIQNFDTDKSKDIPKTFRLPEDKHTFLKYASDNKDALIFEINNKQEKIAKNVTDADIKGEKIIQEFIENPFLIDGYKFDIGVFVVITSVNPLRIYYYNGDILLRFCQEKYYPFDPLNVNKYVVTNYNSRPINEVPVLAKMYEVGYSMRDTLNYYLEAQGKNTNELWKNILNVLRDNLANKEIDIIEALNIITMNSKKKYSFTAKNSFMMLRMDLILDVNMKVYLMKAKIISPLVIESPFQLLNDQVLYNLFSLVGLDKSSLTYQSYFTQLQCGPRSKDIWRQNPCERKKSGADMLAADKNIAVFVTQCMTSCKRHCNGICMMCPRCLTMNDRLTFIEAYREYVLMGDFVRLFPPPMKPKYKLNPTKGRLKQLTEKNRLMHMWYQGKCNEDMAWCS